MFYNYNTHIITDNIKQFEAEYINCASFGALIVVEADKICTTKTNRNFGKVFHSHLPYFVSNYVVSRKFYIICSLSLRRALQKVFLKSTFAAKKIETTRNWILKV